MNPRPQLVYLAFGSPIYQIEAIFSIASALARGLPKHCDIQVFTDAPHMYEALPVTTHPIESNWYGPHGYHFRLKHAVLRQVLNDYEVAALVDTDTFFQTSPAVLFERVQPGALLCNSIGKRLVEASHPPTFLKALQDSGLVTPCLRLTNSGVIGLHTQDRAILERSMAIMDAHYGNAEQVYTFEEICLALAANGHLQLNQCPDVIHHYWSRKAHFRAKISTWHQKHQKALASATALADTARVSVHLPRTPQPMRSIHRLLTLAVPKAQRQFTREVLYGCQRFKNEFDQGCSKVWWDKALENAERRVGGHISAALLKSWLRQPILRIIAGSFYQDLVSHFEGLTVQRCEACKPSFEKEPSAHDA